MKNSIEKFNYKSAEDITFRRISTSKTSLLKGFKNWEATFSEVNNMSIFFPTYLNQLYLHKIQLKATTIFAPITTLWTFGCVNEQM